MSDQCNINNFYDKCMYKDCTNSKSHGKRLYRFPLKTDERHHLWIRNSGKIYINNILHKLYCIFKIFFSIFVLYNC